MTDGAECNQVACHISTKLAPRHYVMNLQVLQGAAVLTPPTIPFQHLFLNRGVFFRVKFDSRSLLGQAHQIHSVSDDYFGGKPIKVARSRLADEFRRH
jgi:hypothetical protein